MQLSKKKIIFRESLNEIDFEEFFTLLKTPKRTCAPHVVNSMCYKI